MSVLESMRSGTDSTAMQILLAAVLVSFMVWGAGPSGNQGTTVATVNGTPITDTTFRRAYLNAKNQQESLKGSTLTEAEESDLRVQVRQQLIQQQLILDEAAKLNMQVSGREIALELTSIRGFQDEDGKFDPAIYEIYRRNRMISKAEFEEQLRRDLLIRKMAETMFLAASVSEQAVRQEFVNSQTRVDLTYVRVRPGAFLDEVDVPEEALAAFAESNSVEIQERFDLGKDSKYSTPETVELAMIATDSAATLNEAIARLEAGEDFSTVATASSIDPTAASGGSLGTLETSALPAAVRDAVQAVEIGSRTAPVEVDGQQRIYTVLARTSAVVPTLDDVRLDIAREMYAEIEAPVVASKFARDELLAQWQANGMVPEVLVIEHGLASSTTGPITIGSGGLFRPPADMLSAAMTAEPGAVLPEVYNQDGVLWVGQLTDRTEPDMDSFETNKARFYEIALQQRRAQFQREWIDQANAQAKIEISPGF